VWNKIKNKKEGGKGEHTVFTPFVWNKIKNKKEGVRGNVVPPT
jgi:hypothetical protein